MDDRAFSEIGAAWNAATWAASSAIAAWLLGLLSICLTGGGLLFVWRQLKATETAANAAWMTARPWLKVEVSEEAQFTMVTGEQSVSSHLSPTVTLVNVGQAPALDIVVTAWRVDANSWASGEGLPVSVAGVSEPIHMGALLPGDDTGYSFGVNWPNDWRPSAFLGVRCEYTVPGLAERRCTAKVFNVVDAKAGFTSISTHHGSTYESERSHIWKTNDHRTFMT